MGDPVTQDENLEQRLEPARRREARQELPEDPEHGAHHHCPGVRQADVHHLEREDLVALTVEAAAMARVLLAGTDWIPGQEGR